MRTVSVVEWGAPPAVVDAPEHGAGPGHALVRMRAAALNPVDLAIASGRFYMPLPDPPFTAGAEAVGEVVSSQRLPAGTRVWCLTMTGAFGELVAAPEETLVPVPDALEDAAAAALGIAGLAGWMPVRERGRLAPGETVVVLGASGIVGQVAVQAARLNGAARVVAVARSAEGRERALRLGADAAIATGEGLAEALREACGEGADLVVDALWGDSAAAAIGVLSRGGRHVQVGNAERPSLEVVAGPLRGGRIDLLGFSVFSEDRVELRRAYAELAEVAALGEVEIAVETVPLVDAPAAWARQAAGTGGRKQVLVP
jgi:NADPH:quinone reductase-like Zn-dependent oxidoreductase